jgi:hypothetical protein
MSIDELNDKFNLKLDVLKRELKTDMDSLPTYEKQQEAIDRLKQNLEESIGSQVEGLKEMGQKAYMAKDDSNFLFSNLDE